MQTTTNSPQTSLDAASTPMLKQYHTIKAKHKDCILFFRLGDFYEMFFEDAKIGSEILDLVLTSRGKDGVNKIPMCGIPFHAADAYIHKLIKAGKKIAICEQVEDPAVRQGLPAGRQGIVKRDVIRTITSGTFLDENSAETRYLFCLTPTDKTLQGFGIAFIDPATGTIQTNQYSGEHRLIELLAKFPVCECIFPTDNEDQIKKIFGHPLLKLKNIVLSPTEDWSFNHDIARKSICEHFGVHNLKGFGIEEFSGAIAATGALLEYLKQMNKQPLRHIDKIMLYADEDFMFISPAAHYGLEFDSLFRTIDYTLTPLGKRQLHFWLYHPLKQVERIRQRQEAVKLLKGNSQVQHDLKAQLSHTPDIEKSISRLSSGIIQAKDLLAIRNTLAKIPNLQKAVQSLALQNPRFSVEDVPQLRRHLEATINPDIPLSHAEGKIIREGCHKELDDLRNIQENGRQWLKNFQEQESKRSGINSLKVGFNNVFGYYIEITNANKNLVPSDYIRKQTLVNGERYITPQLKEYEEKILTARDKILKIENDLCQALQKEILDHSLALHAFCQTIATLDAIFALSVLAQSPNYILPDIHDDMLIDIKDGRHPVVEKTSLENFVANDSFLNSEDSHLIILTGPNMAGKSTYIRQTALLVVLAQMGSYIPAVRAHIGIVDKIFTRIGAHDDISKGQSTFMVEMSETADIVNNLSSRSLVILDEIGRGTSTFDGLSLAWALAEHFQKTKARTLFATHYHELTTLADQFSGVKNYNVAVKEWKDEIIFLHKIIPGSTDDSYGIYVAKLAGIPKEIINRSKQILTQLERNNLHENILPKKSKEEQLSLFSGQDKMLEEIKETIAAIDINNLTPIQALKEIEQLKGKIEMDRNKLK